MSPDELSTPNGALLQPGVDPEHPDLAVAKQLLADNGVDVGDEEGFGPQTAKAVLEFRKAFVPGKPKPVVDLPTWRALLLPTPSWPVADEWIDFDEEVEDDEDES